jgi:hypothetical protein
MTAYQTSLLERLRELLGDLLTIVVIKHSENEGLLICSVHSAFLDTATIIDIYENSGIPDIRIFPNPQGEMILELFDSASDPQLTLFFVAIDTDTPGVVTYIDTFVIAVPNLISPTASPTFRALSSLKPGDTCIVKGRHSLVRSLTTFTV